MWLKWIVKAAQAVSKTDITDFNNQSMLYDVAKAAYITVKAVLMP